MAVQNNANIGFEKQIWDAACVLWGHIPAAEYRKVIVGLIFLRYISSAFEKRYQQLVEEGDGFEDDKDAYAEDNIFFVPEDARWSKIASAAHTPEIGTVIDDAMRAIEKENTTLKNVLPKNYASPDLDKRVLGEVVDLFTNMDMGDTEESKDLLGRTYEYCIQQFAAYEGVKGGEFYTPASIVKTIVAILKPFKNCRVYDPCCGSGGMFVQSAKFIQAHSGKRGEIAVYGQESNADTWKMAKMNMAIRGIDADFGPYQADTFFNDLHKTLKADFIMANPPFNLSNWGQDKLKDDVRWKYGTPPAGNANYAWIQHMIHHLAPNGKIGLVLANGALSSQSSGEGEIRKNKIITMLDQMQNDDDMYELITIGCVNEEDIEEWEAQEKIDLMFETIKKFLKDDYLRIIADIKHKLNLYITMALGRLRYLKNHEVDMRGHVERTLKYMLDMMTEAGLKEELPNQMSEMIRINQNKYIDAQSIRMPQNRKRVRQQSVTEIETLTEEDLYNLKKVYEKEAKNPYSKKITKQYIKTLIGNRHELSSAEVPLDTKEDLLMILSAAAYAEENGFKIEIEEGYFEAGKMVLRSFRILEV